MWRRTHPQRAENDKGASIERGGRFTKIYSDGVREMDFAVEDGRDENDKYVLHVHWELPLRWNPPYESEPVSNEEAQKIRDDLIEAQQVLGGRVIFSK